MTSQPSDYTGHVDPGGLPATRDLPDLTITKLSVGPMDNNAYLLVCKYTGEALLIDAANEADRILALLDAGSSGGPIRLRRVLTTHRHGDHHQALADVSPRPGPAPWPVATTRTPCRSRSTCSWTTGTRSRPVTHGSALSRCAGTRPDRWHCSTAIRAGTVTCSPATRCSPAARARRPVRRTSLH